jgi:hypothetical protein
MSLSRIWADRIESYHNSADHQADRQMQRLATDA